MKVEKKQPLFSADDIATQIHQQIRTVLTDPQMQNQFDPSDERLAFELSERFLKKFVPETVDKDTLELDAFLLFEEINHRMAWANTFIYPTEYFLKKGVPSVIRTLLLARRLISAALGDFDEDEFFANCKHSSGTTLGVSYRDSSPETKFKNLSYSEGVDKWFKYYLSYDPQLKREVPDYSAFLTYAHSSRATTVPKDSKKVRMICIEPTLNMFFQQGLMTCLVTRLKNIGLSLTSQQDENRRRAWLASLTGHEATIDWSSASDSLSYELVKFLLPQKWFYYLDQFRSKRIDYMGGTTELHMFSTMGNACTFPLETLVFWALATAVQHDAGESYIDPLDSRVAIFGDDCILETSYAKRFMETLQSLGFQPNVEKSFIEGGFRESCGGDFLRGKDVRGFYLTGPSGQKKNHLNAWLNIIFNRLLNRAIRLCGPLEYVYAFHSVFDLLFSLYRKFDLTIYLVPTDFPDDSGLKIGYDLFRFLRYYRIRDMLAEVTVDRHGTKRFNYLLATYPTAKKTDKGIRLWIALKALTRTNSESVSPEWYKLKRHQSYVVAKAVTPVFSVNLDGRH